MTTITSVRSSSYVKNAGAFSVPATGGTLGAMANTVAITDTTAKTLFTLPKTARVMDITVSINTDFNGTSPVLDIGLGTDEDYFANNLGIDTLGTYRYGVSGFIAGRLWEAALTADTDVTATVSVGGSPSTGLAVVIFHYILSD